MDRKNLIARLTTSFVFIVFFMTLFKFRDQPLSNWIFLSIIFLALPIGIREFVLMGRKLGYQPSLITGVLSGWVILLHCILNSGCANYTVPFWLILVIVGAMIHFGPLFFIKDLSNTLVDQALTLVAVLYLSMNLGFQIKLFMVPNAGWKLIFALYFIVWLGDSTAYFLGNFLGRHKLAPSISPKKTWEGAFGNLMGNFIATAIVFSSLGYINVIVIALLLGTVGQLGDLIESAWKRSANVKDSDAGGGISIPGHGGLLDRIDSLAFAAPVLYAYFELYLMHGLN